MGLTKIDTIDFDDLDNQISLKILSNHHDLYAMWIEKNSIVMQIHYSKKENQIKLLEGTLGNEIKTAELTEEQKIGRCTEALQDVLLTYYYSKSIQRHKEMNDNH